MESVADSMSLRASQPSRRAIAEQRLVLARFDRDDVHVQRRRGLLLLMNSSEAQFTRERPRLGNALLDRRRPRRVEELNPSL
jgi:hypothetical protein